MQPRKTIMARTCDCGRLHGQQIAHSLPSLVRALFLFLLLPLLFQAPSDTEARDILVVFVVAIFPYVYTLLYEMRRVAVA